MNFITDTFRYLWESINSLEVNFVNSTFRLILSMILGMIVGAERKRKGQTAGIRTFALISMGACLAMLLSIYVPQVYMGLKNGDPGRIAAQVITGIGFLGGGAMIHLRGAVRGLTTAAGIWMTAIIGMAVGIGMYAISIGATALIILTLVFFEQYEKRKKLGQVSKVLRVSASGILTDLSSFKEVFSHNGVHLSSYNIEYDYEHPSTTLDFVILAHAYVNLLPLLQEVGKIPGIRNLTLSNQLDL